MINFFDVIVVGAGPAGSSAAESLAAKGKRVLVVEKDREIGRNILCAEGISRRFSEMVKPGSSIATEIRKIRLIVEDQIDFTVYSDIPFGYILERRIFDRLLFERALEKGAIPLVNAKFVNLEKTNGVFRVTILEKGQYREYSCNWVIGADGPGSSVGKKAGLDVEVKKGFVHYCYQVYLFDPSIEGDTIVFYYSAELTPGGYAWVFPKKKGFANVGIGVETSWEEAEYNLKLFLEKYFPQGKIGGFLRGIVPFGGLAMQMSKDNVILVGDAGRLADPMSGGGIANAYISGKLAAEAVDKNDANSYGKMLEDAIGKDYRVSSIVKKIFYSLDKKELIGIFGDLKRALEGKKIEDLTTLNALKLVVTASPKILQILLTHGGTFLNELIRRDLH